MCECTADTIVILLLSITHPCRFVYTLMHLLCMHVDAGGVYESVTIAEHMDMPRADPITGKPMKLTSNILKDGSWVGARPRPHTFKINTVSAVARS